MEPVPHYAKLLREARPGDQVIEAVVSDRFGHTTFAVSRQGWPVKSQSGLNSLALKVFMHGLPSGPFTSARISQAVPPAGVGPKVMRQCALRSTTTRPLS